LPEISAFWPTLIRAARALDTSEIAIRRSTPDLGELVIHFPRIGFRVTRD